MIYQKAKKRDFKNVGRFGLLQKGKKSSSMLKNFGKKLQIEITKSIDEIKKLPGVGDLCKCIIWFGL